MVHGRRVQCVNEIVCGASPGKFRQKKERQEISCRSASVSGACQGRSVFVGPGTGFGAGSFAGGVTFAGRAAK